MSRLLCIIEIYCMFCIICIIHNTIEHLSGCRERLPMVCVRTDFVSRKNSVWGLCTHRNFDFFSMLNVTLSRLLMSAACGVSLCASIDRPSDVGDGCRRCVGGEVLPPVRWWRSGWCVLMGDSRADRQAVRVSARIGGDVLPSGCGGCPTSTPMSCRCVGLYPLSFPRVGTISRVCLQKIFFEICGNAFGTDATGRQDVGGSVAAVLPSVRCGDRLKKRVHLDGKFRVFLRPCCGTNSCDKFTFIIINL